MTSRLGHILLGTAIAGLVVSSGAAADWNQWRGPSRDGVASSLSLPTTLPDTLTKRWSVAVGAGYSGAVAAEGRVYVHSREGDEEVVRGIDAADGRVVWRKSYPAAYEPVSSAAKHGKGPFSTPIVSEGRLFTFGITGVLSAFRASDGELLWRKDFRDEYSGTWPRFGASASPIIVHGKLILHVGTDAGGALTAFDPATGKVAWRWTDEGPAYASPVLVKIGGGEQLVTQSFAHSIGVNPETGAGLWKIPYSTPYSQNSVTPVVHDDLLIFSGTRSRTLAVRVQGNQAEEVWTTTSPTFYMGTPVIVGDTLYGFSEQDSGNLVAMDPRTGKVLWKGPGRLGDSGALIVAGNRLLALTSGAELIVTEIGAESYAPLKTYSVADSATYAHPAILDGRILIKDQSHLTAWSFD